MEKQAVIKCFFLKVNNLADEENLEHLHTLVVRDLSDADGASFIIN